MWLASSFFSSKPRSQFADSLNMIQEKVQETHSAATSVAPVAPVNPGPVEPTLRYRWQTDHAYVYSVSLEIDQDADRVVTMSGDLTYSVSSTAAQPGSCPDKESKGTGTAFVIHPDGYLLTCHHVTSGATKLEVAIAGKTYPATVVIDDDEHDLAIIHIDADQLPYLPLADSESVQQGEEVRAIGFPLSSILGENIKATRGTISGINEDEGRKVFQIDAAINPGNSGGPLVNEKAEVVGVIYAKLVDELATSVGFATPINDAKTLLKSRKVAYVEGRVGGRLDGPSLVKEVSAATALVTVTSVGDHNSSKGRVSLRCDGKLEPRSWRRSGQPGDALDPSLGRQIVATSVGSGNDVDQVETDALGRIYAVTGHGNLPGFMGHASRLIVEKLPRIRQRNWSYSQAVTLSLQQGESQRGGIPWGPRFGPGRFGPPGFGRRSSEPTTREYPGTVHVDYVLGERVDHLLTIQKSFDLKTAEVVGAGPRIQLKGQGDFVIDTTIGVPHKMEFSAQLIENEAGKTTTTPVKLTYKFLEDRKLPPGLGPRAVPSPVATPGKPVEADSKIEVGSKLVCDWAGKWLPVNVLLLNADGTFRIHWEGWSDQWDEDVPRSRLRFPAK